MRKGGDDEIAQLWKLNLRLGTLLRRLQESDTNAALVRDASSMLSLAAMQLQAVIEFLDSIDDLRAASAPIRELGMGMLELLDGRASPLFDSVINDRKQGRRKDALADDQMKVMAAVALHISIEAGINKREAARGISDTLHRAGFRAPNGKPITARAVEQWRERISENGRGGSDLLRIERIRTLETRMKAEGKWPPTQAVAARFVKGLPAISPQSLRKSN